MNFKFPAITLLLLTLISGLYAQSYKEHRGNIYFDRFNYKKAIELYTEVLSNEPDNHFIMKKLAECNKYLGIDSTAARYYEMYFETKKTTNEDLFNYAMVLKDLGKYKESNALLKEYYTFVKEDNYLLTEEIAHELSKKSLSHKIALVEASSPQSDFSPAYFGDKIIFVSSRQGTNFIHAKDERTGEAYLQLYIANKDDNGQLINIEPFDNKLNSKVNEGPVSFCPTDSTLYFTRNNFKIFKGKSNINDDVNLKIYQSRLSAKDHWGKITEFQINNAAYSIGHPSISKDGKKLYFASNIHDGKGGTDIYVSTRIGPNEWSLPTNLKEINTAGNEAFPFIHENGDLYFASDGLPGIGGYDIFKATPKGNRFEKPTNLRAPINSTADDFGLIADSVLRTGYFSSNRENGKGGDDLYVIQFIDRPQVILSGIISDSHTKKPLSNATIQVTCDKTGEQLVVNTDSSGQYSFQIFLPDTYKLSCTKDDYSSADATIIPNSMQIVNDSIQYPVELSMYGIYGSVFEKETNNKIEGVEITITNKSNNEKTVITTDENGEFKQLIQPDTEYTLFFDKDKYFIKKDKYSTTAENSGWVNLNEVTDLAMDKVEVGKVIEIPNIYYDKAKWDIRTDAAIELDKVVEFMADNPTIKIELGSHTDARGGYKTNQRLSQKRAESAVNYIVESGIDKSRISAHGYGEQKIKNKCKNGVNCSEEEHQQNRRTEIKIVAI